MYAELPIQAFPDRKALRDWLIANHETSKGIYVRIYKKHSGVQSVSFEEVLDEGLCFGWSENKRLAGDEASYLQRFTPRASKGTVSARNLAHAKQLITDGLMTRAGLAALDLGYTQDNSATLNTYEEHSQLYRESTRQVVSGDNKEWLDRVLDYLPQKAAILELGSATGRDATYLEQHGYDIMCSDAVHSFVKQLHADGHSARYIDALKDPLVGSYDLVLANMVFLHFTEPELVATLLKIRSIIKPAGLLAFSVREGTGEEWSNDKLHAPRFYKYWSQAELKQLLLDNQFDVVDIRKGDSTNLDKIYVIARPEQ